MCKKIPVVLAWMSSFVGVLFLYHTFDDVEILEMVRYAEGSMSSYVFINLSLVLFTGTSLAIYAERNVFEKKSSLNFFEGLLLTALSLLGIFCAGAWIYQNIIFDIVPGFVFGWASVAIVASAGVQLCFAVLHWVVHFQLGLKRRARYTRL